VVNLKGFRKIFLLLTEMLQSSSLLEGRGELRKIWTKTKCDSTKFQTR